MYLEHQSVILPDDTTISVITDFGADGEYVDQQPIGLKIIQPGDDDIFVWVSAAQAANIALSLNKAQELWGRVTEKIVLGWHYGYGSPLDGNIRLVPNPWTDGNGDGEDDEPECHG